jgi:hypothetical protein
MRLRYLFVAVLVVGCAGKQLRMGDPVPETYYGRDSGNPEIPKTDSYAMQPRIEAVDRAPTAVVSPTEGMAPRDGHYQVVRHFGNDEVQAVSDKTQRWPGTLLRARSPKFGEPTVGAEVFYAEQPVHDVISARGARWAVGKVEGRDAILGKLIVSGHKVDPAVGVLIPLESLPDAAVH